MRNFDKVSSSEPEAAKYFGDVFDDVWNAIAPQFVAYPEADINVLRTSLAKSIVRFAKDGFSDPQDLRFLARSSLLTLARERGIPAS